ncbi:MAG: hypothetical protein WD648_01045 [Planctomycetaceae bacterium]
MRSIKRNIRLFTAGAILMVLAGCQSYPKVVWMPSDVPNEYRPAPAQVDSQGQTATPGAHAAPNSGYLAHGPVVSGTVLPDANQKIASERAVELHQQNESLKSDKKDLEQRIDKMAKDLDLNQQALARANSEMQAAQTELASTRTDLEAWQQQLSTFHASARQSEQQQSKTLEDMIQHVKKLIQTHEQQQAADTPAKSDQPENPQAETTEENPASHADSNETAVAAPLP